MSPSRVEKIPEILGESLRKGREAKKLSPSDLAGILCLSTKHILQLEEGGETSFFSKSHKVQVAKKVADYLGLSYSDILHNYVEKNVGSAVDTKDANSSEVPSISNLQDKNAESNNLISDIDQLPPLGSFNNSKKPSSKNFLSKGISLFVIGASLIFGYNVLFPDHAQTYQQSTVAQDKPNTEIDKKLAEPIVTEPKQTEKTADSPKEIASEDPCTMQAEGVPNFIPPKASYYGNFVYLVSKTAQQVCVIDGKGKKQAVPLAAGENKNVVGVAPFTILAKDFSQLAVYFQGWRAIPSSKTTTTLKVQEAVITVPNQNTGPSDQKVD